MDVLWCACEGVCVPDMQAHIHSTAQVGVVQVYYYYFLPLIDGLRGCEGRGPRRRGWGDPPGLTDGDA